MGKFPPPSSFNSHSPFNHQFILIIPCYSNPIGNCPGFAYTTEQKSILEAQETTIIPKQFFLTKINYFAKLIYESGYFTKLC